MPSFDTHINIRNLGQELVLAYEGAAQGTTPGLKGDARERAVRTKLEAILPGGVGVGTGCVIDCEGNSSSQIDVILFEQQFCPIFRVAEDVGYYPCESVIAVGEIKSVIGKKELGDIYEKVASVRKLNRFPKSIGNQEPPAGKVEYRTYLDKTTRLMDGNQETIQNSSSEAQIYGFGLGRAFGAKAETMVGHTIDLYDEVPEELRPNVVLTLNQEAIAPAKGMQMSFTALGSPGVTFLTPENSLEYLLVSLFGMIQYGITSPGYAFGRYVVPPPMDRTLTFIPPDQLISHQQNQPHG